MPVLKRESHLSPDHRFVIALHSPDGVVETGLLNRPTEKKVTKPACNIEGDILSSPVRWAIYCEIRALLAYFEARGADFLCTPDCVAERASRANPSPREFPANREKYREFWDF